MACMLCATRRPRRYCPGVGGDICSICCGNERENTVNCPLDCEYLREARTHEKPRALDAASVPHPDVRVTDAFLHDNRSLIGALIEAVLEAAFSIPGVIDDDVHEALDALARTYRTRQSGLYYDTKPRNLVAAGVFQRIEQRLEQFRKAAAERDGITTIRDADVLGAFVFLERVEDQFNNGRKRGRAFLDFLRSQSPSHAAAPPPSGSGLVLPYGLVRK